MSKATINLNVLSQYVTDRATLLNKIGVINGNTALIMDDPNFARQVKTKLGTNSIVIHRRYQPTDAELFMRHTPQAWIDLVANDAQGGLMLQCHNEPHITSGNIQAFVNWNVQALKIAHQRGIRLSVGTFGVGNPHEDLVNGGAFDPMLRELYATDSLMVHEYFRDHPTSAYDRYWHTGRVEHWLKRLQALNSPCKTIIIGEYGRDRVESGAGGGLRDGWRDTGWSAQDYANRLIDGVRDIYAPLAKQYGVNIYVTVFCAGSGAGGGWQSFNVEQVEEIYQAMTQWNESQNTVIPNPSVPKPENAGEGIQATLGATSGGLRIRRAPNLKGEEITQLGVNTPLTYYEGGTVRADGYTWNWIESGTFAGWSAQVKSPLSVQYVPVVKPPTNPFKIKIPLNWAYVVTGRFGEMRNYPNYPSPVPHEGIDFAPSGGAQARDGRYPILASADGIVEDVRTWDYLKSQGTRDAFVVGYGIRIIIRHEHEGQVYKTYYCHLSAPSVRVGDTVKTGDVVGILGSTGNSTGAHLHFNLVKVGAGTNNPVLKDVVDPEDYFDPRIS